jgi:glutathione S-transferase
MPRLLHFSLDPASRRIRLALAEYGVNYDATEERPWQAGPDLFAANPAGTVPVFIEDDGSAVCGSEAVSEYLEETRGADLPLIPGDALARAEVRRLVSWFDTKFYAEVSEPVLTEKVIRRFLPRAAGGGAPDMSRIRHGLSLLRGHLDYIAALADARPFLAGPDLSMADLAAAAHLSAIDYLGDIPWADHSGAKSWYQRLKSRPSFRSLLADQLPGMAPAGSYADLDF